MSSVLTDRPGGSKPAPKSGPRESKRPHSGRVSLRRAAPRWIGQAASPCLRTAHCRDIRRCSSWGDLLSLDGLPGVAEVAMQSGRRAARAIVRRLRGEDTMREFRYYDLGTMATVSRFRAVAWLGPLRVGGAVAWLLWLVVHLAFLAGFKNRVATLVRWAIAFLGRGRPERTITERQVFARTRKPERGSGNARDDEPDDSERRVVQPALRPTPVGPVRRDRLLAVRLDA